MDAFSLAILLGWLVFSIALIISVATIDAPCVDMASPFVFCMFLLVIILAIIFWHTDKVQTETTHQAIQSAGYAKILNVQSNNDDTLTLTVNANGQLVNINTNRTKIDGNVNSLVGSYIKYDPITETYIITEPKKAATIPLAP
ncbi:MULTISPECIES: hypothetical protein [Thermoanaerobacterium]|uniref:Uncharacterized protein (UPF0333 family) n=1 Tax=Thermoanaerobacterium butyriciformans TaxID=1702242 RepID=A0ABS4NB55_9THEO|nr:hypothetical protein [Thermoanaerobacterium butyriciformans]MBP2070886.1 uncharacterized protein (UPF0333 family) [Thermoanaerobacterium butyriciformans]